MIEIVNDYDKYVVYPGSGDWNLDGPLHDYTIINDVMIDIKIAPLVSRLWELGLETQFSCEALGEHDYYGRGVIHERSQILFPNTDDALMFTRHTRDEMIRRSDSLHMGANISMETMAPYEHAERWSVRFHKGYIETVTEIWLDT